MRIQSVLLISAALAFTVSAAAATITAGSVITPNTGGGILGTTFNLISSAYSVTGGITGGSMGTCSPCFLGMTQKITGFSADLANANGSVSLGSGPFQPALLYTTGPGPQTQFFLNTSPFILTGPGAYSVSFSFGGTLQAALSTSPTSFILNDNATGYGTATFNVVAGGPAGPTGLDFGTVTWTFSPEPGSLTTSILAGLSLMWWRLRTRAPRNDS